MSLNPEKLAVIDYAIEHCHINSFADLGGSWGVHGGYSFYALDRGLERGMLVDSFVSSAAFDRQKHYPGLEVITGDFGVHSVAERVEADAVFLFDVLLHQVMPNWDYVLSLYAKRAKCFVIYNQQWTATKHTVRLTDLGKEEFFRNTANTEDDPFCRDLFERLYETVPEAYRRSGPRAYRDHRWYWQWGITDSDLIDEMSFQGFRLEHYANHGRAWELPNFENHAFVFVRDPGSRRSSEEKPD